VTARLLLAHVSSGPEQVASSAGTARWLFLAQDYRQLLEWRDVMAGEELAATRRINRVAAGLRRPFLDLITELGRRYDSVSWWTSRVSERNTAVSPLFLYCCYLRVAAAEIGEETTCIVSESFAVLASLADIARARDIEVQWIGPRHEHAGVAHLRAAWRIGRFAVQGLRSAVAARKLPRPDDLRRPLVLIRTWVDEASFGEEATFRDRYLPGLADWLEARGVCTITLPVLANLRVPFGVAWRSLLETRRRFLAPEAYYRVSDYLSALREARRSSTLPDCSGLRLEELDVSRVFDAERRRAAYDRNSLEALLSYRLPLRLSQADLEPDVMIDPFENMIPEKPLILGFRHWLPRTKIVGYQHGALYPLLLCNFVTHGETEFAPLPDRVVCNGPFFREVLVREGLPPERAVVGPALRYAYLQDMSKIAPTSSSTLLVVLPLVVDAAVELLVKVAEAFCEDRGLRLLLKPHPMGNPSLIFRDARLEQLPSNFEVVSGTMEDALAEARVVIGLASSAVYEAVAAGRPVVVVGRDAVFDMNPLAYHAEFARVFTTPHEIRAETLRLLDQSEEEVAAYRLRADSLLRDSFHPVTDEAMAAFVDGLVELPG
jgi:hypothetical protein